MVSKDFFPALNELEQVKKIDKAVFLEALEIALISAYKRNSGEASAIEVRINSERQTIRVYAYKTVVEEVEDPDKQISLEDARIIKKSYVAGDRVSKEIFPKDFGRIAAQTAKQIINQKLREIENKITYDELQGKEDKISVTTVRRVDGNNVYVDMGKLEAVMLPQDQMPNEKYRAGDKLKVYVKKVKEGTRGPQVMVSRSSEHFVRRLFEQEVPEINAGLVEIKGLVREAGYRTKLAVWSGESSIDPVGACVGNKGIRVNSIVSELSGEKIDVIAWDEDIIEYIARAMNPAKVLEVTVYEREDGSKTATVVVPDDKLSLAIGRNGQNARLAVKLTGCKIDVKSQSEAEAEGLSEESQDDSPEARRRRGKRAKSEEGGEPEADNAEAVEAVEAVDGAETETTSVNTDIMDTDTDTDTDDLPDDLGEI
jgi:N utilization substance protein A